MDFNKLDKIISTRGLKFGVKVYCAKYGIGKIINVFSKEEIVIQFDNIRERMDINEVDIKKFPENVKRKGGAKIYIDGQPIASNGLKRYLREN